MKIFYRAADTAWAMTPEALQTLLEIAERQNETPEAVAARLGRKLENTYRVEMRDGVAVLPVEGPLFRYANLFTQLSGATSYELLARDFAAALEDKSVRAIVLNVNSPGGEVDGVNELADMIYAARGKKPIVAYVGGMGASGGYWIAAQADEIVIDETAILGSIGVRMAVIDTSEAEAKAGRKTYTIVSSQSPHKVADLESDEGRARVQQRIDALAEVFVEKVARARGVTRDKVLSDFGGGDVFVGRDAINAGLADRIGSLEQVIAELQAKTKPTFSMAAAGGRAASEGNDVKHYLTTEAAGANGAANIEVTADAIKQHCGDVATALINEGKAAAVSESEAAVAAAREEATKTGVTAERERVKAILGSEHAKGRGELAQHLAFGTDMDAESAVALLQKSPKGAAGNDFLAAMAQEKNPSVGTDEGAGAGGEGGGDAKSIVARIVANAKAAGVDNL